MTDEMEISLMHKEIPVANFIIDSYNGRIISNITILEKEALPIPVLYSRDNDFAKVDAMQNWVLYRSVPASRSNFSNFLEEANVSTPSAMAYKSLGLNLTDQYWYKPLNSDINWKDVNLFDNEFLRQDFKINTTVNGSIVSPDSNSNGELPKFWCIRDGQRLLYKQGDGVYKQQPYNEVFASILLDKLELNHVHYEIETLKSTTYSVCESFINTEIEYIPALDILPVLKKSNNDDSYQHFLKCAKKLNIPVSNKDIDNMLVFDAVINNSDRHYGNFGFIRDANSLKFKGFAPIFDNGNSLWYKNGYHDIGLRNQESKPFKDTHEKQLKIIKTPNVKLSLLTDKFIKESVNKVFLNMSQMDEKRMNRMIDILQANVNYLKSVIERNFTR